MVSTQKPLIKNSTAIAAEIANWEVENNIKTVLDRDGTVWTLSFELENVPDVAIKSISRISLKYSLEAKEDSAALIRSKVLDPVDDERLLMLLHDKPVRFWMSKVAFSGLTENDAKKRFPEVVPEIKKSLLEIDLRARKRELVHTHIENSSLFGNDSPK